MLRRNWKVWGIAAPVALFALIGISSMSTADDKKGKDVVDTAVEAKFTVLADLLKTAGLVEELKKPGPFTVFAPDDAAFNKLGKEKLDGLKKPESKAKLSGILTYHVVSGKVMAADVLKMDGKEAATLNKDAKIKIAVKDNKVTLNGNVNVTKTDVGASNGVIHVIDGVLMPAEKKAEEQPKPATPKGGASGG